MPDVINYRHQVKNRLVEKKKVSDAKMGVVWLLMIVIGMVIFTLLKISILFADGTTKIPTIFKFIAPLLAGAWYSLWKARWYIKESELTLASSFVRLAIAIGTFSLMLLVAGAFWWLHELKGLPRYTAGGIIVFLSFYSVNLGAGIFHLWSVNKRIKLCLIHSRNMDSYNKAFLYWAFLLIAYIVFLLL